MQTFTGIKLDRVAVPDGPACPFHPPTKYAAQSEAHDYQVVHTPIKESLDHVAVNLRIEGAFPWSLGWSRPKLMLGFVSEGWAKLRIDSSNIDKLEANQWFWGTAEELLVERTSASGAKLNIVLCSREVAKFLLQLDSDGSHPLLESFAADGASLPLESGGMNAAARAAADQIDQSATSGIRHRLQLESSLLAWTAEMLSQSAAAATYTRSGINANDREAIETIVAEMRSEPGREFSLAELCTIGRINDHKLKQAFKKVHGKTAFSYLREVRMDHAARLLEADRLSVIQIANEVGYSNASHFARAFKDRYGLLPKAYQCLHRL